MKKDIYGYEYADIGYAFNLLDKKSYKIYFLNGYIYTPHKFKDGTLLIFEKTDLKEEDVEDGFRYCHYIINGCIYSDCIVNQAYFNELIKKPIFIQQQLFDPKEMIAFE